MKLSSRQARFPCSGFFKFAFLCVPLRFCAQGLPFAFALPPTPYGNGSTQKREGAQRNAKKNELEKNRCGERMNRHSRLPYAEH
jgi:hypothetical protein